MTTHQPLIDQLEAQGRHLFRWRGQLAALLLPTLALALWSPGFPGTGLGDNAMDDISEIGLVISLFGLALRWFTVGFVPEGTSGRNTREQRAAALNTQGMYSIVRHPLYLANAFVITGFAVATDSLWFLIVVWLGYALAIERIIASEERFLRSLYGSTYEEWVANTPLFVPHLSSWQRHALPFSVRTVLRREYNGFFGVCLAFFALESARDIGLEHQKVRAWMQDDGFWVILLMLGLFVIAVLRTLKRRTRRLHVTGR